MGSSVLRAFRAFGCAHRLSVYDNDVITTQKLKQLKLADQVASSIAEAVHEADVIILAIPIRAYAPTLDVIAHAISPDCIVTDVGSVKGSVTNAFSQKLPKDVFCIPAHPIAGLEKSGPDAGTKTMFSDRWLVITPSADCPEARIQKLKSLWQRVGSNVAVMTPEEHDTVMAVTSHLPHLLSFCMMMTAARYEQKSERGYMQYSAGGFSDFTRIAASDPTMWKDILLENSDNVLLAVEKFIEMLDQFSNSVRTGDENALLAYMRESNLAHRNAFGAKNT
ncbi:MAG: prephenate dehydrogenase/arogenate dehydrogenase family protein [Pseudomonadota bacterium]